MVLGMAAMIAVSCGEKKDAPKEGEATTTEAAAPKAEAETPAAKGDDAVSAIGEEAVLNKYIELVDKLVDAQKAKDTEEINKLTQDLMVVSQDIAKIDPTKLTKEQAEKLAAIGKKYQEALMAK